MMHGQKNIKLYYNYVYKSLNNNHSTDSVL